VTFVVCIPVVATSRLTEEQAKPLLKVTERRRISPVLNGIDCDH
jgi:hypothetical protein